MLPSVTEILSDEGVGFDMSHLPPEYAERGTLIHKYAENLVLGRKLPEIPQDIIGFANAVNSFVYDVRPKPVLVEPELIHDKLGVVGHLDLLAEDTYYHDLYDYKTGSIPKYTGPQTMGYKIMVMRMFPLIKSVRRWAVLIEETGKYKLKEYTDDALDLATFMTAYHGYFERRGVKWSHRT
jgi:hypothetical protein